MKTSLIRYRVADFLRESPPFDAIAPDDLLALAASGKVSFHESDEFIFRQGLAPKPCFWVIQQGTVQVIDDAPAGPHLHDLLGAGDLLGLDGLLERAAYAWSAQTTSDVILYSIDAAALKALWGRYPSVATYLASHASLGAQQAGLAMAASAAVPLYGDSWLDAAGPPADYLAARLQLAEPAQPLVALLRETRQRPATAIAVVDDAGAALGIVTDAELRARWIADADGVTDSCAAVMTTRFVTAAPAQAAHCYLAQMMAQRVSHLVITPDGAPSAPVQGLLSAADLSLLLGCNPVLLQHELLDARTPAAWRLLLRQARALKVAAWSDAQAHERVAALSSAWDRAFAESIVQAALAQVSAEALSAEAAAPDFTACCWLLFGAAGRGEDTDPARPEIGVIYCDPAPGRHAEVAAHFRHVEERIAQLLDACGLEPPRLSVRELAVPRCQSQSQWKAFFDGVIAQPVENDVHAARRLFDVQVLFGDASLASALASDIAQAMAGHPHFIPILANDTLDHLPPMTFFQGLVIESDGAQTDTLDLAVTALVPIVDAARVYALVTGSLQAKTTLERLDLAARVLPDEAEVFREAAAAFRIVSRHTTLAALKHPHGSPVLVPGQLGKRDQRLLKTSFQSIQTLLELTSRPSRWTRPH